MSDMAGCRDDGSRNRLQNVITITLLSGCLQPSDRSYRLGAGMHRLNFVQTDLYRKAPHDRFYGQYHAQADFLSDQYAFYSCQSAGLDANTLADRQRWVRLCFT